MAFNKNAEPRKYAGPPATTQPPAKTGEGLPARVSSAADMQGLLDKFKTQIQAALPKQIGIDRFVRTVMLNVTTNPKLLQCEVKSFMRSVMSAAILGLEPGTPLQHAHLVPFWNSQSGAFLCQFMIGYRGFIDLARRSAQVSSVYSRIVYEKEYETGNFVMDDGVPRRLIHRPIPPEQRGDKRRGAYAVAVDMHGNSTWEWMWASEIEAIKKKSLDQKKNPKDNPWVTHEEAMWLKCPIRKLAKFLPLSTEWQKAAVIDEYQESGVNPPFDPDIDMSIQDAPETGSTDVQGKTEFKAEKLKEKLNQEMATSGVPQPGPTPPWRNNEDEIPEFTPPQGGEPPLPPEPPGTKNQPANAPAPAPPPASPPVAGGGLPLQAPPKPSASPKKPADYWLPDKSKVKCPPNGLKEDYLVDPPFCKSKCYMVKNCIAWKDNPT